jgi:transposase-like protein
MAKIKPISRQDIKAITQMVFKSKAKKTSKQKKAKSGKFKYTPEERLDLVQRYQRSGLALRQFARLNKIPAETLRCWVIGKYKVSPVRHAAKKKTAKK